ncbi:MAG: O-methyltransferase [Labilithrix sp.]|nr:O-methyltransferase [Labilithrix sp.]
MKHARDAILGADQGAYLEGIEPARDPLLAEMEQYARERRHPISDPEVASFLAVTTRASGATRIVELGTNIGYAAIVLARAAGPAARVVTIEHDPKTVEVARGFIERAGLTAQIDVRQGDALAELEAIAAAPGEIDLVYIDCVKEDYPRYLEIVLPKLSARGVVIADNVMWKGLVAKAEVPANEQARVEALRAFNRALVSEPRLRAVVLPLGDGVGYAVRT